MRQNTEKLKKQSSQRMRDNNFTFSNFNAEKVDGNPIGSGFSNACNRFDNSVKDQDYWGETPQDGQFHTPTPDTAKLFDFNTSMGKALQNLIEMRSSQPNITPLSPRGDSSDSQPKLNAKEIGFIRKPTLRQPIKPGATNKSSNPSQNKVEEYQGGNKQSLQQNLLERALIQKASPEEVTRLTKQAIGSKIYKMTDQYYWEYSQGIVNYEDMKIKFSWSIMNEAFQLFNTLNQHNTDVTLIQLTKEKKFEVARLVDREIRDILEYMLMKYPPSRKKIVDTDLAVKIKQVKRHTDYAYDILRNANFQFDYSPTKHDYSRDIKRWLNRLIIESKAQFSKFRSTVKKIFTNRQFSDGGDSQPSSEVEFLIGSKINQSTPIYTEEEIKSPGLKLKRPELLRILMKWLEELLSNYEKTDQRIVQNKVGFKSVTKGMVVNLTKKRKEVLSETLKNMYIESIVPVTEKRTQVLDCLIMDLFNLTSQGFEGYDSFGFKDVVLSKISQYLSQCIEAEVLKLLNVLIYSLNSVRERFDPEVIESSLDLVTFSVLDLLRCRCVGSKQQIVRIFNSLKDYGDYFQIIRVKNKLNESTRDLLINLKLKDSFLICELQLGLGQEQEEINDHFSHYLYELWRSRFPVLMECANQIVNQDPKVAYFTKDRPIKFIGDNQMYIESVQVKNNKLYCSKNHPETLMEYFKNQNPFCCNQCNKFIEAFTYYLEYLRCHQCLNVLCPPCLVDNCIEFQEYYLSRYIKIQFFNEFFEPDPYFKEFGTTKKLLDKALEAAKIYKYVMTCEFDNEAMKLNIRKVHKGRLVYAFQCTKQVKKSKVNPSNKNWNFVMIPKNVSRFPVKELLYFQKMHFKHHWHEFDEWINEQNITDLFVIYRAESKKVMILDFANDSDYIDDYLQRQDIMNVIEHEAGKTEINLDLTSRGLNKLSDLSMITNKEAVKILNLWENQITDATPLAEFNQIQELYMRDNLLPTFEPLLVLQSLQVLNLQRNKLSGSLPVLNFPNLKLLDISNNEYEDVNNMSTSALEHLTHLFIGGNKLITMPNLSSCPEIDVIYFQSNDINNMDEFAKSDCPNLRKLHGCRNKVVKFPLLKFQQLDTMWLHNNQIEDISNLEFCELPKLQILKLNNNKIKGALPVVKMESLLKIELNHNEITDCQNLAKWQTSTLLELYLNNNQIKGKLPNLPFGKFRKLYLQNNKLDSIDSLSSLIMDKKSLQQLQILDLSFNLLGGTLPPLRLRKLKQLNLSNNKFSSLQNLSKCKLPFLEILNLSHNIFSCVVPVLFFEKLVQMKLDGNDIQGLEFMEQRQLIPKLRIVSLQGNQKFKEQLNTEKLNSCLDIDFTFTPRSESEKNFSTFEQFINLDSS